MPLSFIAMQKSLTPAGPASALAAPIDRNASAAAQARRLVTTQFGDRLGEETLDDLLLVVSELVSNALLHGSGDIELRMAIDSRHVTGSVVDEGAGFEREPRAHDPARVGGHGLYLVGRIAERWGMGHGPTSVWFQIPVRH